MRILHLSKFYPPDQGGLERVVEGLAEGAVRAGHSVRVVCAVRDGTLPSPRGAPETRRGVDVVRVPTFGMWWSQPVAPRYLAAAAWPAQVVYVHRPHPLADLAALRAKGGARILFHHSDVQRQRVLRALYQPLAHKVASQAAASVVASRWNLAHAEDLGEDGRARARVIPLGVDIEQFAPRSYARPRVFPSADGEPVGIFVGRLVPYKGLDVLMRALAQTRLRVALIGGGPMESTLANLITREALGDRVTMVGDVPEADLPAFYNAADYAVLPSTTPAEAFGVAAVEAMACGKPVITTDLESGVRDVNVDGQTGLVVPPANVAALRQAMERLADDQGLRHRLGAAARERVVEKFSLDAMVAVHLALCEEVVSGRR